ncbi:6558_t:CDS:1 [Dentiscutata erythropus]|uniref:6558_t:CDS:1 n=1 Tax=Dentiscutata erythropus TaxID=1348616 RepID=A0A9N9CGJ5_9GLOM|nr:6558_t:CDS:1 [Dentiscutata erythropus]
MTIFLCTIALFSDLIIAYKSDNLDNELESRSFTNLAKRQEFTGDISFTNVENGKLGECEIPSTNNDLVCALSTEKFDKTLCGKKIKITRVTKSVTVTIVDRCEDCKLDDLTLTSAAFNQLGDPAEGVIKCTWDFLK